MGKSGQEQSTHRNTKTLQSNNHRRTICLHEFIPIHSQSATSKSEASKHYNISNSKTSKSKSTHLQKHKRMKLLLETFNTFKNKKTNEEVRHTVKSRRYEITNEEEITNVKKSNGIRHRTTDGQNGIVGERTCHNTD